MKQAVGILLECILVFKIVFLVISNVMKMCHLSLFSTLCERLSVMHEHAGVVEILVQIHTNTPMV